MIDEKMIAERRDLLLDQLSNLQSQLVSLEDQKLQLQTNINAVQGAIQQCDYFTGVLNSEPELKSAKEEKKK